MAETMDAEKMARTIVDEYVCQLHAADRKQLCGQILRVITTAHNSGLERAAEIAEAHAQLGAPDTNDAEFIAQAIRREIK